MRVIGLLSGTSHDAIEAAAADIELSGDVLVLRRLGATSLPFEAGLRAAIGSALPPASAGAGELCRLDARLGQAFADAAAEVDHVLCGGRAELVVSHGQTVFHWVEDGRVLGTMQLGEPAWISERTGLPVVSNLRSRDVAAGGQGAPLVSFVDCLLLPPGSAPRAALNLGGIANLTVVPPSPPAPSASPHWQVLRASPPSSVPPDSLSPGGSSRASVPTGLPGTSGAPVSPGSRVSSGSSREAPFAYDAGPANALVDAAVSLVTAGKETFDAEGRRAARGRVVPGLLDRLLADPYYALGPPKSTGKERFNAAYLTDAVGSPPSVWGDDLVATVTVHAAEVVARECRRHGIAELFVSGGGTRNPALMGALADRIPGVAVRPSDDLGIPEAAKEAYTFAILGFMTFHGVPATIPTCTGASHSSLLGSITPGAAPLQLPPPADVVPRRIEILAGGGAPSESG